MTFPRVILKRCYCEMSVSNLLKGGFLGVRYLYQARDYKMREIIPPTNPSSKDFFLNIFLVCVPAMRLKTTTDWLVFLWWNSMSDVWRPGAAWGGLGRPVVCGL